MSVYALDRLVGITAVTSDRYPGSASAFLGASPDAAKLHAWTFARTCGGKATCTEVPKGGCPTGIDNGRIGQLAFRTYLEPATRTAPHPTTLVRNRVLRFRRRAR